jgi:hypothetical protein
MMLSAQLKTMVSVGVGWIARTVGEKSNIRFPESPFQFKTPRQSASFYYICSITNKLCLCGGQNRRKGWRYQDIPIPCDGSLVEPKSLSRGIHLFSSFCYPLPIHSAAKLKRMERSKGRSRLLFARAVIRS